MKIELTRFSVFCMLLIAILFFVLPTQADTRLLITDDLILLSINGHSPKSISRSQPKEISIGSGLITLALTLKQGNIQKTEEGRSRTYIARFYSQPNQSYKIRYLKSRSIKNAEASEKISNFSILNSNDDKIESKFYLSKSNVITNLHQQTRPNFTKQSSLRIVAEKSNKILKNGKKSPKQMLLIWWEKANRSEREAFLREIKRD